MAHWLGPQCIHRLLQCTIRRRMPRCRTLHSIGQGRLAQELLELTARITARADEDPFGNPVLLVALAISRRIEAGALDDAAIGALIATSARRRLRGSCAAHRGLCRRHRCRGAHRGPEGAGATPAAPRSERQPGALGGVPRPGGTHALRGGVHRASDIRASGSGRSRHWRRRRAGGRPRLRDRIALRRSRWRTSLRRLSLPSSMAAMRSTSSTRHC